MSGIVGNNTNRGSGLVKSAAVGADSIDGSNIADDAIDSEHYTDGSIDNAHIADDAIDSEHYADGSIDNAHIADDAIDSEHYAAGSIDEAHIADNAVSLAKMAGGTDGNVISYDASGDPVAIATGDDGQVLTSAGAGAAPAFEDAAAGGTSSRNDIINGGYLVNQENDTSATDDAYSIGDLFNFLGEAAATTSLQTSGGPQGDRKFSRINIDTANKQAGWVYFLTNADVQDYIANGKLSFGVKIKTVTSKVIGTVRIGILKWTGTADSVTSDVVGTWAQDGTNPTLATSWSYENTPADINITTSWVRYTVEDITVDSDTNNIGIFIWIDDGTIAQNDQLDITEWQLNPGSTVDAFSSTSKADVFNQVVYFYEQLGLDAAARYAAGLHFTVTAFRGVMFYANKRVDPTVTIIGVASDFESTVWGGSASHTAVSAASTSRTSCGVSGTGSWSGGQGAIFHDDGGGNSGWKIDARL